MQKVVTSVCLEWDVGLEKTSILMCDMLKLTIKIVRAMAKKRAENLDAQKTINSGGWVEGGDNKAMLRHM